MSTKDRALAAAQQAAALAGAVSGSAIGTRIFLDTKEEWDHDRWVKHFETLERYPEAMSAMRTMTSKLKRSLE